MNRECMQAKAFAVKRQINIDIENIEIIKNQIWTLKKNRSRSEKYPKTNIKHFFIAN